MAKKLIKLLVVLWCIVTAIAAIFLTPLHIMEVAEVEKAWMASVGAFLVGLIAFVACRVFD